MDARCQNLVQGLVLCLFRRHVWRWSPSLSSNNKYVNSKHVDDSHQSEIHIDRHHHNYWSAKLLHLSRYKNIIKPFLKMKHVPYQLCSRTFSSTVPIICEFHQPQHLQKVIKPSDNPPQNPSIASSSTCKQHTLRQKHHPWHQDAGCKRCRNWAQKPNVWCIHWEASGALQNPPKHESSRWCIPFIRKFEKI